VNEVEVYAALQALGGGVVGFRPIMYNLIRQLALSSDDVDKCHAYLAQYRDAIERNAHLFRGKVVLDVGCGTGILSLFASRAGARLVIGVDASDIIHHARRIVEANGCQGKVLLLNGTMEKVSLPEGVSKVDVIVSEWMGYAALYESMLPSVMLARDRYLVPGGCVLPTACPMFITASSHNSLGFWDDCYGFDMRPIADAARADASVEIVPEECALSPPVLFRNIDCTADTDADLDFSVPFELPIATDGVLTSFVVHFDAVFDLSVAGGTRVDFSTGFSAPSTHWKQTVLYLRSPNTVASGSLITGTVGFSRSGAYKRAYDVIVTHHIDGGECGTQVWRMH